jgi:hypothetical protein
VNPSSSWLWELWETRRVFQVVEGNARRFPQPRQLPQPSSAAFPVVDTAPRPSRSNSVSCRGRHGDRLSG